MDDWAEFLAGLPHPVLILGRDERIAMANRAAEALFGVGLAGRHHAFALRHPEALAAIAAALAGGGAQAVRLALAGPGQGTVWQMRVWPLRAGAACLFEDLTAAEQAEQMRSDFVANVSHELKTPLTALTGMIETLQGAARDDPVARARFLGIMAGEAERMSRLVSDLLQLSRVEAQERQRPQTPVDLAALVLAAANLMRPLAERAGVALQIEGAEAPAWLPGDADQLTQVLTNLIENAVKYGGGGGWVGIGLRRETGPRGPLLRLTVADRGEGIDPRHLPRLSERFYRIDGHRSREKGGTGLGLAIVKHIVQRHRGRLVIDSAPGQGAQFSVLLPLD